MANFDYLKAQIAARIHDNTEQEITAEDVRRSFNDTIDAINAAKEDEGAVAPAAWGGITGTLSAQTDLKDALDGKQAVIADLGTIRSGAAAGATAYQKPSGGIPKTDLNNAVQSSLDKADSAYQKPGTGIPKADLASGVQTSLGKADTAYQKPNNGIPKSDLTYAVQTSLGKADSAVQPGSLAAVATSGSYNDLLNKPTIPAAPGTLNTNNSTAQSVSSSEALSGTVKLHKVSKTGSYNDLTNKPTIPAAQVQSDWDEADNTKPAYIKNKPAIPSGVTVDQVYDATSANAQSGVAMAGALAGKEDTISDLSTIRSGAEAGATAVQPGDLAAVATSGQYSDLTGTPTIPAAPGTLDTTATTAQATSASEALSGSVVLHKISKTGKYSDLSGKPTVPVITLNGSTAGTPSFYAPTSAGTAGQVLVSTGGAPTWQAAPSGGGDVTDVTLGGTSVVDGNGVAVLPAYPVVPTLATVATTGDYDDLLNKPTIPADIDTVNVSVDNNTGTPSATGSVSGSTLTLAFSNLKGATGPQGIQGPAGNTGSSVDYPYELVNNFTDGGVDKGLTAEAGKTLYSRLFGGTINSQTEVDISSSFTWVNSRFIAAANPQSDPVIIIGNIFSSGSTASRANNDYVDISAYSKLRISLTYMANANNSPGLCFYDASKAVVEAVWRADRSPASMTVETLDVPAGAKYVRTTWRSDYGSFTCIGIKDSTVELGGVVSPFVESQAQTEDITTDFTWTQSKYRTQVDGSLASSGSSSSYGSNLVDVGHFDKLQIYVPQLNMTQTNAGWAWYDANQNFIIGNALIGSTLTMRQVTLSKPKNAVYFATTKRTDGADSTFACVGIINERKSSQVIADWAKDDLNDTANVRYYGAVGDGVVDDTAAVLLALASGARRIYFPAGTYLVGKTINIASGWELYGDGIGATVLKFLGASNSVQPGEQNYDTHYWRTNEAKTLIHTTAGGSNIYIHDIEVDGSDFQNSSMRYIGLSICGVTDTKIENVCVHDINYDATRSASVQMEYAFQFFVWYFSKRVQVTRCYGYNAGYENIGTEDVEDVVISDCAWGGGWRTSLQIHRGSQRVKVVNNTIDNTSTTAHASLTIHGVTTNPITELIIQGNTIHSTTNENQGDRGGVSFVQSGFKDVIFEGNTFDGNSFCIVDLLTDGTSSTWPANVIISNNVMKNSRYGIKLLRGNNYIIKDNIIDAGNTAINIDITRYIVKDNILPNNTTKTLNGTPWTD